MWTSEKQIVETGQQSRPYMMATCALKMTSQKGTKNE